MRSDAGWQLNDKRIERLWRCERLNVPKITAEENPVLVQRRIVHSSQAAAG
tara:strand:- start:914 stop:1066 length:153 start_codon:yes stop_codon:yes gene_type:complete